jgi:hypothetical protein
MMFIFRFSTFLGGCYMKLSKLTVFGVILTVFFVFAAAAFSQNADSPVTIASILKNAGCPLTGEQAKQLKEIEPGQGFSMYRTVNEMFDEKQTNALKQALGTSPGRNNRPERPRNLFQVIMFENAGCPLTESQVKKLKELPMGQQRGGMQEMMDILTDEQQEVMEKIRESRGIGAGQRGNRPGNR